MRTFGCIVASILVIAAFVGVIGASTYANYEWVMPWKADKKTEIVRNTNQYVTTQQRTMQDAWHRYNDPEATEGQKQAAIQDWCTAANMVDDEYVIPSDAKVVGRQEGCWNGS